MQVLFEGSMILWNDRNWRKPIQTATTWYLEANLANSIEPAIVAGQAALELIAWLLIGEQREILGTAGFEQLPAADKLRLLSSLLRIPVLLPNWTPHLTKYCSDQNRKWNDTPRAATELRNSIVHPKNRCTFYRAPERVRSEAKQLITWYLSLVRLRLFGFEGDQPDV